MGQQGERLGAKRGVLSLHRHAGAPAVGHKRKRDERFRGLRFGPQGAELHIMRQVPLEPRWTAPAPPTFSAGAADDDANGDAADDGWAWRRPASSPLTQREAPMKHEAQHCRRRWHCSLPEQPEPQQQGRRLQTPPQEKTLRGAKAMSGVSMLIAAGALLGKA